MFDTHLADIAAARTPSAGVRACARLENAACAARLGHMADMLAAAYSADGSADREQWRLDNWAAVCAQIGAAHDVTSGVANGLLTDAVVLRERLPTLAEVFATGAISYRLVHQICTRTMLVQDRDAVAALDTALAALVGGYGALSKDQAEKNIDHLVLTLDPFAVRRTQNRARNHHVDVAVDDASGSAQIDAVVSVTDAKAFDERLDALAATVCQRDHRTRDDLRAAAVGAVGFGWDHLPCMCESPDCNASSKPRVGGIIIHVIARHDTLDTPPSDHDPDGPDGGGPDGSGQGGGNGGSGEGGGDDGPGDRAPDPDPESESDNSAGDAESDSTPTEPEPALAATPKLKPTPQPEPTPEPALQPEPTPAPAGPPVGDLTAQRRSLGGPAPKLLPQSWYTYTWSELLAAMNTDRGEHCPAAPGVILGGAIVPAPVLAQAARYATIRTLIHPGHAPPQPQYRPSKALAEFIRCRDQTCRFPGCTRPATIADIDHTVPYPWGPTAASNLACLCRLHHLLKTFWPGWSSRQDPDGTLIWTDPDGHTYTTYPGSRGLFPELCEPTAHVTTATPPAKHTAGLTMPRRKTTRHHARHQAITTERRHNRPNVVQHLLDSIAPF